MTTIDDLIDLLMKHLQGNLTVPEQEQLDNWLTQSEHNRRLFNSINDEEQLRQWVLAYHQEVEENNEAIILAKIKQQINSSQPVTPVRKINTLRRWAAVAAILLLVAGVGGYFWQNHKTVPPVVQHGTPADIPPGRDGAILTLADGRKIVLDSLGNGVIANQNGTQVLLKNGAVAYTTGTAAPATVYNTLTTPKGRQFQLILPDGSHVWLNAASSLRYPTSFSGNERRVEVTGEVYFEVSPLPASPGGGGVKGKMPFIVNINGKAQVEVLGTHFNVNAYANETAIRTTLLEGKVKVESQSAIGNRQSAILKPGEQISISHTSQLSQPIPVQTAKVMAWKNGVFNFEDASLEEVMRQLERWYDIEVVYENGIPDITFGGKMSNDVSLSGLLKSLQQMDVHFRVEGRKLIVLK